MRKKDFLICYDISDKKRLSKIAKTLEREALRIQRSVYFYEEATKQELNELIDNILKNFNKKEDELAIYTIKDRGIALGSAIDLKSPLIF